MESAITEPPRHADFGLEAQADPDVGLEVAGALALQDERLELLYTLELAIPPAWARCFYTGDLSQLTDGLTNFARLNSCPWIVTWLKSFDQGFMSLLQDPAAPLQDYRATLKRVLALPSAPRDLEQHPDFLLEPTMLVQLPWSAALLQQWLATALLEVTRFETVSMELRLWPMPEEIAQLATQLLNLVKVCKERLLLGLALLARDVTTYPTVHQDTPRLILDEAVLPAVPVLRFILHGEARAVAYQLKERAFSTRYSVSEFHMLKSVFPGYATPNLDLTCIYCKHYFHPFYWLMDESAPPFPSVDLDSELVNKLSEKLETDPGTIKVRDAFIIKGSEMTWNNDFHTPAEVAHTGQAPMRPGLCALIAQLKKGPPSLLRELLAASAQSLLHYEEVRELLELRIERGVTPVLLCSPELVTTPSDCSLEQGTTPCSPKKDPSTPHASEDTLPPCDLSQISMTLRRVWVEVRVANRAWLIRQFPCDWPRDFMAAVAENGEGYGILESSTDHKQIVELFTRLLGSSIIHSYDAMFGLHDRESCSEPLIDIYTMPCLPLIVLRTITPKRTFLCNFAHTLFTSALTCHSWKYIPHLRAPTLRPMRRECPKDSAALLKAGADLQLVQDHATFSKEFLALLVGKDSELKQTLSNFNKAHFEWTSCFTDLGKIRDRSEMVLFMGGNSLVASFEPIRALFEKTLAQEANKKTKTNYLRLFNLKNSVLRIVLEVYWASYLLPELQSLPSLQLLKEARPVLATCGSVLIKYVMCLAGGVMREGDTMNPHETWVWTILGSFCALISDVFSNIDATKMKKLKSLKKDCFSEFQDKGISNLLSLKPVPLSEAMNNLRHCLQNNSVMWDMLCEQCKIYKKEESKAGLSSELEAMRLDTASGGAEEVKPSGGGKRRCLSCQKPEGTPGFKGDYCSTQCKIKHAQGSKERRCLSCKKTEGTPGFKGDYCSTQCKKKHAQGSKKRRCPCCQKPEGTPGFKGDFCSAQCKDKNAQESKERRCVCCKKPEGTPRFKGDFCSTKCRDKWRAREEKRCTFCRRSKDRCSEFLQVGQRAFCSPQCRDQWRANGGRPYETGGRDCSHCGRAERKGEQFSKCPECEKEPPFPVPYFYCSVECRDTWWELEHRAQHLEFELGLPWWDSPN